MLGDEVPYINVIYEMDFEPCMVLTSSGPISCSLIIVRI